MEKVINESIQGCSTSLIGHNNNTKKLYIESYGCQMNFSDSEIVASILLKEGFNTTSKLEEADLVLVNTCSIRDKAEQTKAARILPNKHIEIGKHEVPEASKPEGNIPTTGNKKKGTNCRKYT